MNSIHTMQAFFYSFFCVTSGTGSVDPIPLQLKTDRQGLGRAAAIEELKEAKRLFRVKKQEAAKGTEVTIEQFRARLKQKSDQRLVEIDLFKSQKSCYQLDTDKVSLWIKAMHTFSNKIVYSHFNQLIYSLPQGYTEPADKWFWPKIKKSKTQKVDCEGEEASLEQGSFKSSPRRAGPAGEEEQQEEEEEEEEDDDEFEVSGGPGRASARLRHLLIWQT